jgi:hypothetical protein
MQTLKQLLLSLVNATVMLAVVLVLLTLVLVSQVGQLADATTAAAEQASRGQMRNWRRSLPACKASKGR